MQHTVDGIIMPSDEIRGWSASTSLKRMLSTGSAHSAYDDDDDDDWTYVRTIVVSNS